MLGSHNSWTFASVKQWYYKPFKKMAQCQSKDIVEQYEAGVQFFDLRLKPNNNGTFDIAHGCIRFNNDWRADLEYLNARSTKNYPIYTRLMLEYNNKPDDEGLSEALFEVTCDNLKEEYPNINWVGGYPKYNMTNGIFPECQQMLVDKYSSTTSLFKTTAKSLLGQADDLYPKYYASKFNKKNKELYKDILESKDKVLFIDFI